MPMMLNGKKSEGFSTLRGNSGCREDLTFLIDLTPHDHHALAGLLVREATLVLLVARVPLFVGVVATCQKCSSKLCCLFGTIGSRVKISIAEAAVQELTLGQLQATMVQNGPRQSIPASCCVGEALVF